MLINEIVEPDLNNSTEAEQIEAVKNSYEAIKNIKNPSENVKMAAVTSHGPAIFFIRNPSREIKIAAINQNPHVLEHMKKQPVEILNKCKNAIIKVILNKVAKLEIPRYNDYLLAKMIEHTNWPELNVIRNSVEADDYKARSRRL